jgi:hypothetical protein
VTPDEFDAGMGVLLATWPKEATTADTLRVYQMATAHLDGPTWLMAVKQCVMTCTFFPKPAELLAAAVALTTPDKRSGADAWGDVQKAIRQHGYYHPPGGASVLAVGGYEWNFDDKIAGEVVAAFGWGYLCMSEDEMADRAHFIKSYEQKRDRAYADARLTPDLLAFRDQHQAALPAPADRRADMARLLAGVGQKGAKA